MKYKLTLLVSAVVASLTPAVTMAQETDTDNGHGVSRQLPEFTAAGELRLPKGYETWVYVGSPLTPNALNKGKAAFPEYHNVYIEPGSYQIYKKTGIFPEGTMMYKELQLTLKPEENSDGSRTEPSGRGFFPGVRGGAEVSVKDTKKFSDSAGWGYFDYKDPQKDTVASLMPISSCAYCHIDKAKKDMVWTQFYRLLDN
jgi:hypothetical protein